MREILSIWDTEFWKNSLKILIRIPVKKQLTSFIIEIVLLTFWHSRKSTSKLEIINLFTKLPCPFLFQIFCGADQIFLWILENVVGINKLGKFLLLSWTYLFILILGRFKVEVYSGANFQIVEPIASVKKCKCQWKDDAWDFVNLGHGIQCLFRIIHSPSDAPLTPQCTVENQTRIPN